MSAVPKLRFSEFEDEWTEHRVSNLSTSYSGGTPESTKPSNYGGEIPFIRSGEIGKDTTAQFLSESGFSSSSAKMVEKGDLLIAMYGANSGDVAIAKISGAINQAILCIKYDGPSKFLFEHYTRSQAAIVHKFLQGGQGNLSGKIISEIEFRFPSLPEQKKIADFLGAVDEKIAGLRERERLLTQYKKGVMQKIFTQTLRFKADDGRDFPDWEDKKFGEVFERVTRKNSENNKNVLTISAQQGLINQEEYFNKSVSAKDVTGYYLIKRGEFAYNKSYSKGYPMGALKRLTRYDAGVVSTLYICFVSMPETCEEFYEHYFESGLLNRELHKIAQEGARNHGLLNLSVVEFFRDMSILYPHPDEQQKIADFLSAIDDKITAVSAQITQMQDFKKGLLQQMFV